jgi:Flp pilus assembly protein TadG
LAEAVTDHSRTRGARRGLRALPGPSRRREQGAVTAEAAVALPVLVGLALGLVWLVSLAVTQVRVVDAARETARALARDEPAGAALRLGRRVAPDRASITIHEESDVVRVDVVAEVRGPGGLFAFLPGVEVDAAAVAAKEPS